MRVRGVGSGGVLDDLVVMHMLIETQKCRSGLRFHHGALYVGPGEAANGIQRRSRR